MWKYLYLDDQRNLQWGECGALDSVPEGVLKAVYHSPRRKRKKRVRFYEEVD